MSWLMMIGASAQAGNRASKTLRCVQWKESEPEQQAVTSGIVSPGQLLAIFFQAAFFLLRNSPTIEIHAWLGVRSYLKLCMVCRELHALKFSPTMWNFYMGCLLLACALFFTLQQVQIRKKAGVQPAGSDTAMALCLWPIV